MRGGKEDARVVLVPLRAIAGGDEDVERAHVVLVGQGEEESTADDSGKVEAEGVERKGCRRVEDLAHEWSCGRRERLFRLQWSGRVQDSRRKGRTPMM